MKITGLDTKLVGPKNIPVVNSEGDPTPVTVRDVLETCMIGDSEGNKSSKLSRFAVYKLLSKGGDDFTVEQCALMKAAVLDFQSTIIAGQIIDVIEGNHAEQST